MGKEAQMMRNLLKYLTVCMIAMVLVTNSTTVFASDDSKPDFPDSINPPVDIEYLIY